MPGMRSERQRNGAPRRRQVHARVAGGGTGNAKGGVRVDLKGIQRPIGSDQDDLRAPAGARTNGTALRNQEWDNNANLRPTEIRNGRTGGTGDRDTGRARVTGVMTLRPEDMLSVPVRAQAPEQAPPTAQEIKQIIDSRNQDDDDDDKDDDEAPTGGDQGEKMLP